jgi:murein DD-endopeptidase MepM/ murein hydrolase activator NlpD
LLWLAVVTALAGSSLAATDGHTVRKGETLGEIAEDNHVSLATLMAANDLSDPTLVVAGTELVIPAVASRSSVAAAGSYLVQEGDTLTGIAARIGVTVRALATANGIRNVNRIQAGAVLTVAGRAGPGAAEPGPGSSGGGVVGSSIVQPGDTLARISRRTGVPGEVIVAANGMTRSDQLFVGAEVLLGVRNPAPVRALARCPLPGASFVFDWGFPRGDGRFHQGTDLFASRGTPVRAAGPGTVTQVIGSIGGKQITFLADNGTTYVYSHLDRFARTGHVEAGVVIGYVGSTGSAAGGPAHLHFEVHPGGGAAVNAHGVLVDAC